MSASSFASPGVLGLLIALSFGAALGAPVRHLALESSFPAADAVAPSPSEIRLTFTQAPQPGATSIRLIRSGSELIPTGEVKPSPDDATVFTSEIPQVLPEGTYTIAWRALAQDGHAVAEEFTFTVRAAD